MVERYGDSLLGGGSADELARLRALERIADPDAIRWLKGLGVQRGWRCLEVGAGAGSIARWLADVAGPENVTASDIDVSHLKGLANEGVRVVEHDITVDAAPGQTFDLIHVRHVLEHLPQRDEVVRRLASWLVPRGWLLIEVGVTVYELAGDRVQRLVKQARHQLLTDRIGGDFRRWGLTLADVLRTAGLTEIGIDASVRPVRGRHDSVEFDRLSLHRLSAALVHTGLLSESVIAEAFSLYDDPEFIDLSQVVIAMRGRRSEEI